MLVNKTSPPFFPRTFADMAGVPMTSHGLVWLKKLEGTFWKGIRIIPKFPLISWKTDWIPFIGNSGEFCFFRIFLKNVTFSHAKSWVFIGTSAMSAKKGGGGGSHISVWHRVLKTKVTLYLRKRDDVCCLIRYCLIVF